MRRERDCSKKNALHRYGCPCREEFFRTDRIRMIRKFQEIQKKISGEQFATPELLENIDRLCREMIAPEKTKGETK
jgi:hypothetical protein